jgi:hypothetical protein
MVAATFKDDGYSGGSRKITRVGFGELIAAIEAGQVDVVIVRDIDGLACKPAGLVRVREGVRAAWGATECRYRWGPGPVHARGRVLRRDGEVADAA